MDVRCEKCNTEYELDEAKLKPGGVTVKCTSCGHMFKIRKRHPTNVGAPPVKVESERSRRATAPRPAERPRVTPSPSAAATERARGGVAPRMATGVPERAATGGSGPIDERAWIIRLQNGQTQQCRELGTLQQWIVAGAVTRESMISRNGKTWKMLGDIVELTQFFEIADEARAKAEAKGRPVPTARSTQIAGSGMTRPAGTAAPSAARTPTGNALPAQRTPTGNALPAQRTPPTNVLPGQRTPTGNVLPAQRTPTANVLPAQRPPTANVLPVQRTPTANVLPAQRPPTAGSHPHVISTVQTPVVPPARAVAPPAVLVHDDDAIDPITDEHARPPLPLEAPPEPQRAAPRESKSPYAGRLPPIPTGERSTAGWAVEGRVAQRMNEAGRGHSASAGPMGARPTGAGPTAAGPTGAGPMGGGPLGGGPTGGGPTGGGPTGGGPTGGGPTGSGRPIGGLAQAPGGEAAFARGDKRLGQVSSTGGFAGAPVMQVPVRDYAYDDDEPLPRRRSLAPWILLGSAALIAGAAAVWFFAMRDDSDGTPLAAAADAGAAVAVAPIDAAAAPVRLDAAAPLPSALPDAGTTPTPTGDALRIATDALHADLTAGLTDADPALLARGDQDGAALALRARVATALAQQLADEAMFSSDGKRAKELDRQVQQYLVLALPLARRALSLGADDAAANVAMADLLRLQKKPAREIDRYLDKALRASKGDREALYVRALLDLRDGRVPAAKVALNRLDQGDGAPEKSGDVRPRLRLARLEYVAKAYDHARSLADSILGLQPDHAGARALLASIAEQTAGTPPAPAPGGDGDRSAAGGGGADSYEGYLAKADKRAEQGDCTGALVLYDQALNENPSGVAALTGMGYCHIDLKQFASAHDKFKAALGMSRKYQEAMWGIAEAYQQQGLAPQAIEAYRAYLDEHPNSARATMAKRQIEKLGGTVDASGSDGTPMPTPAPGSGGSTPSGGGDGPATTPSDSP